MSLRVIAKLDVKPPYVVKPVHFEGLRKIGKPEKIATKYYEEGADEILYIDIVASLYQREILYSHIENTSKNIYIPLSVGGGVKSIEDFSKLFHSGADKVALNTFAIQENPKIISDAAKIFGSQSVVVNIEAKKWGRNWECYTDCGRNRSYKDVIEWAAEAEDLGAGEIIVQSVDRDGRQRGFDIELISRIVNQSNIPIIAASGAGSLNDILELAKNSNPDAIALSSVLHYELLTIRDIKKALSDNNIEVSL